ncbi:protein of unknown function [Ectopseudomonas oleovorans]|nr:protein of unknown function [Pseudomonas oleovorans]
MHCTRLSSSTPRLDRASDLSERRGWFRAFRFFDWQAGTFFLRGLVNTWVEVSRLEQAGS